MIAQTQVVGGVGGANEVQPIPNAASIQSIDAANFRVTLTAIPVADLPSGTNIYFRIAPPVAFEGKYLWEWANVDQPSKWTSFHGVAGNGGPGPAGLGIGVYQQIISTPQGAGHSAPLTFVLGDYGQGSVLFGEGTLGINIGSLGNRNIFDLVDNKFGDGGGFGVAVTGNMHGGGTIGYEGMGVILSDYSYVGDADVANTANAPIPQSPAPFVGNLHNWEGVLADGRPNVAGVAGPKNAPVAMSWLVQRMSIDNNVAGITHDMIGWSVAGLYPASNGIEIAPGGLGNQLHQGINLSAPQFTTAWNQTFVTAKAESFPWGAGLWGGDNSSAAVGAITVIGEKYFSPGTLCTPGYQPLSFASTVGGNGAAGNAIVSANGSVMQAVITQGGFLYDETHTTVTVPNCSGTQPLFNVLTQTLRPALLLSMAGLTGISGTDANQTAGFVVYTAPATFQITLSGVPTVGHTLTIGTSVWTYVANGTALGSDFQIPVGTDGQSTATAIYNYLSTSPNAQTRKWTYAQTSSTVITATARVLGTDYNSFPTASNDSNVTVGAPSGGAQTWMEQCVGNTVICTFGAQLIASNGSPSAAAYGFAAAGYGMSFGTGGLLDFDAGGAVQLALTSAGAYVIKGLSIGGTSVTNEGTGTINVAAASYLNAALFESATAPTVPASGSGLGISPAITGNTAEMDITVGSSPSAASFTITLPAASHAWACHGDDLTTQSATVFMLKQVSIGTTTTATMELFSTSATAAAPVANDNIRVHCAAA
jgi:hypothetical protein